MCPEKFTCFKNGLESLTPCYALLTPAEKETCFQALCEAEDPNVIVEVVKALKLANVLDKEHIAIMIHRPEPIVQAQVLNRFFGSGWSLSQKQSKRFIESSDMSQGIRAITEAGCKWTSCESQMDEVGEFKIGFAELYPNPGRARFLERKEALHVADNQVIEAFCGQP